MTHQDDQHGIATPEATTPAMKIRDECLAQSSIPISIFARGFGKGGMSRTPSLIFQREQIWRMMAAHRSLGHALSDVEIANATGSGRVTVYHALRKATKGGDSSGRPARDRAGRHANRTDCDSAQGA